MPRLPPMLGQRFDLPAQALACPNDTPECLVVQVLIEWASDELIESSGTWPDVRRGQVDINVLVDG